ncbi:unnamed protein product [Knipowitschia caucasica]|uniref:CLOCK-interacting pacemaker-like n=1 Tax=Knipowitschia caucasica TaxID=637954 RepID=A0AAV2J9L8_KNICA
MPKEPGHSSGEWAGRSTSKNAKNKSNSATLRASQSGSHREPTARANLTSRTRCRDSGKDSEKDSGYSEAGSDSVDDQPSSASEPQRQSNSNSSRHNSSNGTSGSGNAAQSMPPYKEMTPIYVIKNVMVKPPRTEQLLHSPMPWGGAWHSLTDTKAPTQLLLIQQPATQTAASAPMAQPQNHLKKSSGRNNTTKNSYLPILNSYPRIAPHPRKESHASNGGLRSGCGKDGPSEGQSQSKRVCTEEKKRDTVLTTTHHLKPLKESRVHSHSHHKIRSSHSGNQTHSTTQRKSHHSQKNSDNISSPSVSSSQTPSPPSSSTSPSSCSPPSSSTSSSAAHSPYRPAPDSTSTRQRRFFNTAEILNQSGLLAITLRTKELLKQNAATEREIAQLRQHTQYLCDAAQASQAASKETPHLEKLVCAMSDSGSYPKLDLNQLNMLFNQQSDSKEASDQKNASLHTNAKAVVISLPNIDDGTSPPSPLFAPSPEAGGTENTNPGLDSEKELSDLTIMVDSLTRDDYLL